MQSGSITKSAGSRNSPQPKMHSPAVFMALGKEEPQMGTSGMGSRARPSSLCTSPRCPERGVQCTTEKSNKALSTDRVSGAKQGAIHTLDFILLKNPVSPSWSFYRRGPWSSEKWDTWLNHPTHKWQCWKSNHALSDSLACAFCWAMLFP